jgi:hypothetical protein
MATERRQSSPSDQRNAGGDAPASGSRPSPSEGGKSPNEGEGSRSAARDYNQRTQRFIHEGRVDQSAEEAKRAVESNERDKLEEAERIGRGHRRT